MRPMHFARRNQHGVPGFAGGFQVLLVSLVILSAYLTDVDPYRQLIVWSNTPTLIGVLVLQILTSVAAVRFFRKSPGGTNRWQSFYAPISASGLLCGMPSLAGLDATANSLIILPLCVAFSVGVLRSLRLTGRFSGGKEILALSPLDRKDK